MDNRLIFLYRFHAATAECSLLRMPFGATEPAVIRLATG